MTQLFFDRSKEWKQEILNVLMARKPKGVNRIVRIGYGYVCLRGRDLVLR
jgi:hypothetical protein